MLETVYHSSEIKGLKEINPRESTHEKEWVYAAKNKAVSAIFLDDTGGDFTCSVGRLDGEVYLCERFKGAIELRYLNKQGSIYILSAEKFEENKTGFSEEVVSEETVRPLEEVKI